MSRRAVTAAICLLLGLPACKNDAQRAAAERAAVQKMLTGSLALLPYRGVKTLVRSSGSPDRPKAFDALLVTIAETEKLPEKAVTLEEGVKVASTYLALAKALFAARRELAGHDEDTFPTLWAIWTRDPPPVGWYDNGTEHLALGTFWIITNLIDQSGKVPAADYAFYELSRAEARPAWPPSIRAWALLARGTEYCAADYHYAAEEELTGYLAALERLTVEERALLAAFGATNDQVLEILRAAGHFIRAWNRMGLGRKDPAVDDVDLGLQALTRAGIEDEVTLWATAFVAFNRGRNAEAGQALRKLADSPNLEPAVRAEILESAAALESHGAAPKIFNQARAVPLLGRALLARAGGLWAILEQVVGPERAAEIRKPLEWLDRVKRGVAEATSVDAVEGEARELGARGIDLIKQKMASPGRGPD